MARIAGINIPNHQHAGIALTAIYGIGRSTAQKICTAAGVPFDRKVKDLTDTDLERIRDVQRTLEQLSRQLGSRPDEWRWARLHLAISSHKPFGKVAGLSRIFDERIESAGDLFTVNVGQYWANERQQPFATRHAASMRAVYDLAEPERSQFIYQTGQSGHPFDPRSRDMARSWATDGYRALQLQPQVVRHTLTLHP